MSVIAKFPSEKNEKRELDLIEFREKWIRDWDKSARPVQYPFWLAQETLSNVVSKLLTLNFKEAFSDLKNWVTAGKPDYLYIYDDLLKQKPDLAKSPLYQKLPHLSRDEFAKLKQNLINTYAYKLPEEVKEKLNKNLDHLWVSSQFYKKDPYELSEAEKELLGLLLGAGMGGVLSRTAYFILSPIMKTKFASSILGKALLKGTPEAIGWGGFSIGYDLPKVMDEDSEMTVKNMFENADLIYCWGNSCLLLCQQLLKGLLPLQKKFYQPLCGLLSGLVVRL